MSNIKRIRILGIDPGIANTGWAIIDINKQNNESFEKSDIELIDIGLIQTQASQNMNDRIRIVLDILVEKILLVDYIGIEKVFFHPKAPSTLTTAYVIGSVLYESSKQNVNIIEIRSQQMKIGLGLKGNAPKKKIGEKIQQKFKKRFGTHTCDAIGLAFIASKILNSNPS